MEQQQFLRECGRSYPYVMAAVAYFRQLVQKQYKEVVQRRIEEFAEVIGLSRKDLKLTEYLYPAKPTPISSEPIYLGLQAKRQEDLYLYFYSYWSPEPEEDSAPQGVGIDIWIKNASKRKELVAKFDQHSEDTAFRNEPWKCGQLPNVESYSVWMEMKDGDFPQFDEKLDKLFDYTIKFLKSVKGIENYFKP